MWDWFKAQDNDGISKYLVCQYKEHVFILKSDFKIWWLDKWGSILSSHWLKKKKKRCTHRQIKSLFSFTVSTSVDRPYFFNLNAILPDFFSSKRPRSVMAKYYLVDSYSVGVESGWGSQMVGVFDSPDGCSVWCSVTLGRLIDMLPPSPPSLRLLFLHLLLQHSHCYEDGYQPPGL